MADSCIKAEGSIPGLKMISLYKLFNTSAKAILGFSTIIFEIFSFLSELTISVLLEVIIADAKL